MTPRIRVSDAPAADLLAIYLQDHLAGAAAGVALAGRLRASNEGTSYAAVLREVEHQVQQDSQVLERIMAHLGVPPSSPKQLAAVGAERVGRLKLNGQLRGYSPLSRVVELEGLIAGVEAKARLWRSLDASGTGAALPPDVDLAGLRERADTQRARLEELHVAAAEEAFAAAAADRAS